MSLLDKVGSPRDLRTFSQRQLTDLAAEIRTFLIRNVAKTGGHLGPNLGVVELTLAIHRVFESPHDPILFDTGHQAYVHKIITGRQSEFATLRQGGGLSGYPSRKESEHDWIENSHASAALSWGEGMAKAFRLKGEDRTVVVVVGDGALTGGMAWEALNNIAAQEDLRLVIVVNDNGRSYMPTVGGLAKELAGVRTDRRYEQALDLVKRTVSSTPIVGQPAFDLLHGLKVGLKDVFARQSLFSDLGLKYVGPLDGHDVGEVEQALERAKNYGGPVIVHCITRKGKGFPAAEAFEEDYFHAVGAINETTGEPLSAVTCTHWTDVFGEEMVRIGADEPDVVAITAAMLHPVGLARFAATFPSRVFDVGIAEQHAVASAAGLAAAGLHPVVAVYATFLNRAFDQVLMDVALHQLGVTFVLDRAGVTGPDGASHNGMWDAALFGLVPGLRYAAPRDGNRLRAALRTAVKIDDAPTMIRFSKDPLPDDVPTVRTHGTLDVLLDAPNPRVLIVGYGAFAPMAIEVGRRLKEQGIAARVVDPVWALPVSDDLVAQAREVELIVTIEDGLVVSGLGSHLAQTLRADDVDVPVREFGIPQQFLTHGARKDLLAEMGLTAHDIARFATETVLAHEASTAASATSLSEC